MSRFPYPALAACGLATSLAPATSIGATHANAVISYGTGSAATFYPNPQTALGAPAFTTGESSFPGIVSPFNAPFEDDEIVQIQPGGHLTLQLARYALVGAGKEIGVFENVGFIDTDYPNGTTDASGSAFSSDAVLIEVSADNVTWKDVDGSNPLSPVNLDVPTLVYRNAGPFDLTPPGSPDIADFGVPLPDGTAFGGKTYNQIITAFAGSGGGTWLDLNATGLAQVGYIRFSLDATATNSVEIDAVSVNNALVGDVVPEPASALLLGLGLLARRTRR